jgi:uracil phosphoribosyltransferase
MSLPSNVTVSSHPCLLAKLSQLRSVSTSSKETKALVHELALLLGAEALAKVLTTSTSGEDVTPLGATYPVHKTNERLVLVPILRSGLGMLEGYAFLFPQSTPPPIRLPADKNCKKTAFHSLLPEPVPVHHLGLFREKTTLQPVEYYNNLPTNVPPAKDQDPGTYDIAIVVDPVIATGGTAEAAIQTLKEWGVPKVCFSSSLPLVATVCVCVC